MDDTERKTNINVLFQMAKQLELVHDGTNAAEILYLEAANQAEKYLAPDSEQRGKVIIGCIDFYDRLGRENDSELMQARLRSIARVLLDKVSQDRALSD